MNKLRKIYQVLPNGRKQLITNYMYDSGKKKLVRVDDKISKLLKNGKQIKQLALKKKSKKKLIPVGFTDWKRT